MIFVGYSFLLAHAASQRRAWLVLVLLRIYTRNTTMPLMAFTQLVRDAAIRLTSIDLCHPFIPLTIIVFLDTLEHIFIPSQYYSEIKNAISAV